MNAMNAMNAMCPSRCTAAIAVALSLALVPLPVANASSVTIIGRLVDRQCSIEDVLQLQPLTERYCTLTFEETRTVSGITYTKRFTVYCPNKVVDGVFRGAYEVCSDPAAMQIRYPPALYSVSGELRTVAEQADGRGQVLGNSFQY